MTSDNRTSPPRVDAGLRASSKKEPSFDPTKRICPRCGCTHKNRVFTEGVRESYIECNGLPIKESPWYVEHDLFEIYKCAECGLGASCNSVYHPDGHSSLEWDSFKTVEVKP